MVKTTKEQRKALHRKWCELASSPWLFNQTVYPNYKAFRKTIQPCFDGSGCIMVKWCGMWLGIETDGYTHS